MAAAAPVVLVVREQGDLVEEVVLEFEHLVVILEFHHLMDFLDHHLEDGLLVAAEEDLHLPLPLSATRKAASAAEVGEDWTLHLGP